MFALLALPHVAYRLVLKSMDFVDIVNMSICTTKMAGITRDNMYQLKNLDVVLDKGLGIVFRKEYDEICVFEAVGTEQRLIGAAEHVCALFRSKVHTIRIVNGSSWILDWVNNTCQGISKVVYQNKLLNYDDLTHILKNCSAEILKIRTRPQKGFQFNQKFGNFKTLLSMTGDFLTIDNLMAMSCSKIQIGMPLFKSSDVNRFLKNWMNGGSSNLEFLRIGVLMLDEEIVLTGLEDYVRRTENKRMYTWNHTFMKCGLFPTQHEFDGLEVHRKDGTIASLLFKGSAVFGMLVLKK
ncbi:unnamed protein product [Caenorhabditis brenneri]